MQHAGMTEDMSDARGRGRWGSCHGEPPSGVPGKVPGGGAPGRGAVRAFSVTGDGSCQCSAALSLRGLLGLNPMYANATSLSTLIPFTAKQGSSIKRIR